MIDLHYETKQASLCQVNFSVVAFINGDDLQNMIVLIYW